MLKVTSFFTDERKKAVPIYTTTTRYSKLILGLVVFSGILLVLAVIFALAINPFWQPGNTPNKFIFSLFLLLVYVGIFWLALPRRFDLHQDRLVIKLGSPLRIQFLYDTIIDVIEMENAVAIPCGISYATSFGGRVWLKRKGLSVTITPNKPAEFAAKLRELAKISPNSTAL